MAWAVHALWSNRERKELIPKFMAAMHGFSRQEQCYMADFGVQLLAESCFQCRKLTLNFQEMLSLQQAEVFLRSLRCSIIDGSTQEIPLAAVTENTGDEKWTFRSLVAAELYTIPRLQHFRSDLNALLGRVDKPLVL
eukprot:s1761_g14.t1